MTASKVWNLEAWNLESVRSLRNPTAILAVQEAWNQKEPRRCKLDQYESIESIFQVRNLTTVRSLYPFALAGVYNGRNISGWRGGTWVPELR
jgi:hypothetical protein